MSDPDPAEAIFSRDPRDPTVLVADGYGLSLTVNRGHLTIGDGLGRHRRERCAVTSAPWAQSCALLSSSPV